MFSIKSQKSHKGSKHSSTRNGLKRRRGGSVLEMAIVMTLLGYIIWGMVEFAYFFFVKNTMEGAAREGCRAGIVTGATNSACNTAVANQLQAANLVSTSVTPSGSGPYTIGNYTVEYDDSTSGTKNVNVANITVGDTLTVTVTFTWGSVNQAFRPAQFISSTKQVLTASSMRVEG